RNSSKGTPFFLERQRFYPSLCFPALEPVDGGSPAVPCCGFRYHHLDVPRFLGHNDPQRQSPHNPPRTRTMFRISAFADEISPDPAEQITVLRGCGVRHIELRSIHKTNVLDLTDAQVQEFKALLEAHSFSLSAIGSPIGKIRIDEPFEPHLKRFRRAL